MSLKACISLLRLTLKKNTAHRVAYTIGMYFLTVLEARAPFFPCSHGLSPVCLPLGEAPSVSVTQFSLKSRQSEWISLPRCLILTPL